MGNLEQWVEGIPEQTAIVALLKSQLQMGGANCYPTLECYFKHLSEEKVLEVGEWVIKSYPRITYSLDQYAREGQSPSLQSALLYLRLNNLDEESPTINLGNYNPTFAELMEIIPKHNIVTSIASVFRPGNLTFQVIDGDKFTCESLTERRTPIPSIIKCAGSDTVWLYAKKESGELALESLDKVELDPDIMWIFPSTSNDVIKSCKGSSEYAAIEKILVKNGGSIALTLDDFTESERKKILLKCLAHCRVNNVISTPDLSAFRLSIMDILPEILKNPDAIHMLDGYVQERMCAEDNQLSYSERLQLAKARASAGQVFFSIGVYQLNESDRLEILKQAASTNNHAYCAISYYNITDIQERLNLFVSALEQEPDIFYYSPQFNLSNLPDHGGAIFKAWSHSILLSDTDDEPSLDALGKELKYLILPKLAKAFAQIWPDRPIFKGALKRLFDYKLDEDFDSIKMLNMAMWLSYMAFWRK